MKILAKPGGAFTILGKEFLLKGMDQYDGPPSSDQLLLILQKYFLLYKTNYVNEEFHCTEPSPSVRVSCTGGI